MLGDRALAKGGALVGGGVGAGGDGCSPGPHRRLQPEGQRWQDRLNHAGYLWAFSAITASPGAKAHYRRRRDNHGDWHAAAQRNLFNRMLGQLYHCLQHGHLFDEAVAFPTATEALAA